MFSTSTDGSESSYATKKRSTVRARSWKTTISAATLFATSVASSAFVVPRNGKPAVVRPDRGRPGPATSPFRSSPPSSDGFDDDDEDDDLLSKIEPGLLGIAIGKDMALSDAEKKELAAMVKEEVSEVFEKGQEKIDGLLEEVADDFEKSKEALRAASDVRTAQAQKSLMSKIDEMSEKFLSETKSSRDSTKMAAKADMGMSGRGLDLGSWGRVGDAAVTTGVGMVGDAESSETVPGAIAREKRVLIINDEKRDPGAQKIINELVPLLESYSIEAAIESSSRPAPIGGLNSPTAILSAASISDKSSMNNILDRILRRTAPTPGKPPELPPSHVILLSSLGTERTDKMPYSMQNLFGRKLDKLRDVEESLVTFLKSRDGSRPADYTILKFGEVTDGAKGAAAVAPGDSLDGDVSASAAARALFQAAAAQPSARNATASVVGGEGPTTREGWDDAFLALDGPELARIGGISPEADAADRLEEFLGEWAQATFVDKTRGTTGLATPVTVDLRTKGSVQILFKETATGSNYKSFAEERRLENERQKGGGGAPTASKNDGGDKRIPVMKARKNGGVEVVIEEDRDGGLRVRAKRCAMDDDTVVKEMSEEVIVKRLKEAVNVWLK